MMEFGDFFDEGEAKAVSFIRFRQLRAVGIEALECAFAGEVGNSKAMVSDGNDEFPGGGLEGQDDFCVFRRKLDRVLEKVVDSGAHEELISTIGLAIRMNCDKLDLMSFGKRLELLDAVLTAGDEIELMGSLQVRQGFHGREFQKSMGESLAARRLIPDVFQEMGSIFGGHVLVEKFGSALNRGERRLQFMGQILNVLVRVFPPLQGFSHVVEGLGEGIDFTSDSDIGFGATFASCDRAGVVGELSDRPEEPDKDGGDQGKDAEADEDNGLDDLLSSCFDEGNDILLGFVNTETADDFSVLKDGGSNEHHGGVRVIFNAPGRTGAVFALKRFFDIAPFQEILSDVVRVS